MKLATTATLALVAALSAGAASAMTINDTGHQFNELASAAVGKNTNASTWASSVSSIQDNPFVEVVSLSDLGGNGAALDSYLDTTSVDLSDFQRAVRGNYSMAIALNGDNFSASDVVAMKIISGGTVRLVVDDTK